MISVCVLYPRTERSRFDLDYYVNKHLPMAIQCLGSALKGVTVEAGVGGTEPGSPPANAAVCRLLFESVDSFLAAFGPNAEGIQGDISNYTDVAPVIQINEVKISK
jgi:uncharacterized protein (TIGR02118 family)